MVVNVTNTDSFNVYCTSAGSCQEFRANLMFENGTNRADSGQIHCVETRACDDLYVDTNSDLSQLFVYEHSDSMTIDNGAGYLVDDENVVCVTDQWVRFDGLIETEDTVTDSIAGYYPDTDSFPCSDVTVLCGNASCIMTHETTLDSIQSLFDDQDICYLINVQDLQEISCDGLCFIFEDDMV